MIRLLDCTLSTPQANLSRDASLLAELEEVGGSDGSPETLRFWESPTYCVVLGHGSRPEEEVNLAASYQAQVPVLRRSSGGCAVLLGPGCLNFALVLSLRVRPELQDVRRSWEWTLSRLGAALRYSGVARADTSDLTLGGKKFSGSAQRRTRHALLHHGTILYDFDLPRMSRFLKEPARQPRYRSRRPHDQFLCNLPLPPGEIRTRLANAWVESSTLIKL